MATKKRTVIQNPNSSNISESVVKKKNLVIETDNN